MCRRAFTIVSTETVDACVDTWREQQQQPPRTIGSDVNVLSMLANTVAALTNTDGSDTQQPLHAHAQMLHTLITSILVPQLQEQVPTDAQRGAVAAGPDRTDGAELITAVFLRATHVYKRFLILSSCVVCACIAVSVWYTVRYVLYITGMGAE